MRILVLGGTAWVGGIIATTAVDRGHEVLCLARGSGVPAGAGVVQADRDDRSAYDAAPGHWDAVIDVARQPCHVRGAVAALSERSEHYVFVSTGNVYRDESTPDQDETAERNDPLVADAMDGQDDYGAAKVACEDAILTGYGSERSLIARAGLIGGPGDVSGRAGYWPWRFAHPSNPEARVLVPDSPGAMAQLIDVRDLADWLVLCAEHHLGAVANAVGDPLPLAEHLTVARRSARHTGPLALASPQWLSAQGVEPWAGPRSLPLWLPLPDYAGFTTRRHTVATELGLRLRPLEQTLSDGLDWERNRPASLPRTAGLTDAEERELLAALNDDRRS